MADTCTRLPLPEPVGWGLLKPDGTVDHDLVGTLKDCQYWAEAVNERQSGWIPVPLYAADQMHAYSDAENAALIERVKVLEDALRKLLMGEEADLTLEIYAAAAEHARAVLAARKAAP